MSFKAISHVFEEYKKARSAFVYDVCEFASWQSSTKFLEGTDVIELLAPLVVDKVVKIRRRAITAAGKLAERSEALGKKMMASSHFISMLKDVSNPDMAIRKTIIFFMKGITRHSTEGSAEVVKLGVLPDLIISLEEFDLEIKRDAVAAIGHIGKHNEILAKKVVESGALQLFVSCFLQPDNGLQQNVMKAFEDLAQYHPQEIIAAGGLSHIIKAVESPDTKIKTSALKSLALIAGASEELSHTVIESGALNPIVNYPFFPACFVIRNIVKHSPEMAQRVADSGACEMLVELLNLKETIILSTNSSRTSLCDSNLTKISSSQACVNKCILSEQSNASDILGKRSCVSLSSKVTMPQIKVMISPVAEALGFIAMHSSNLAMRVISAKAIVPLVKILCDAVRLKEGKLLMFSDYNDQLSTMCAAVWTLGQIAQHSPEHSESVAVAGTLPLLVQLWQNNSNADQVLKQVEQSFALCLKHCIYRPALEPMLHLSPVKLLQPVLVQYAKILPHDAKARRLFVTTGALQKVQELSEDLGPEVEDLIITINKCFPGEILKYCSPNFVDTMLEHVDNYIPEVSSHSSVDKVSGK